MNLSDRSIEVHLLRSKNNSDAWLERNGWAGFDPYDLRRANIYLRLLLQGTDASLFARGFRKDLVYIENQFPLLARRILGVKKQSNSKGKGLIARGYLDFYQAVE